MVYCPAFGPVKIIKGSPLLILYARNPAFAESTRLFPAVVIKFVPHSIPHVRELFKGKSQNAVREEYSVPSIFRYPKYTLPFHFLIYFERGTRLTFLFDQVVPSKARGVLKKF